ncbi:DUF5655 domain-containing protein [Microbacterium jejuense]|uniref:DUF5655 domain-containing protein n=1 Tax=Microbacterium jejuense TaxID=1263637 RepID=UPI0031EBB5AD
MPEAEGWTVQDHLRGQPEESVALFRAVEAMILAHGEVVHSVSKTTITFKGPRRGFAGARPDRRGVIGYLDLMRPLDADPRIGSAAPYGRRLFVNHFRIHSADELDETFAGWVDEAYAVGCGAHLGS